MQIDGSDYLDGRNVNRTSFTSFATSCFQYSIYRFSIGCDASFSGVPSKVTQHEAADISLCWQLKWDSSLPCHFFFKYISFVMKKVAPVSSLHIDCKFIGHTISPHKTSVTILFLTSNPSHPPTKEEKIEGRPLNAKVLTERKSFPLFPDSFTTLAYNECLCELQFQTPNFPLGFLSLPAAFAFKPGRSHHHFALWKSVPK